ncbi:MAG: hypothetical protein RJQ14_02320 [Marinoscillum sp.]
MYKTKVAKLDKPAKTVWYFGIYLIIEGLFLMLAPASILSAIGIPDPESVWRIVLGFVVVVLGYYYVRNAKENLIPFFGFTVQVRIIQFVFFIWLYVFERGTLALVAFSFIEFVAGMWTWRVLKRSN